MTDNECQECIRLKSELCAAEKEIYELRKQAIEDQKEIDRLRNEMAFGGYL
jgi:predicted RNase H-like nuclease (RuvC/YqgF family)